MLPLFGLQSLRQPQRLLYPPFVGGGYGVEGMRVDRVVIGVDLGQGHHCFVYFLLNDLVIGQLFSQHCYLRLQRAHLLLAVCLGLVVLALDYV